MHVLQTFSDGIYVQHYGQDATARRAGLSATAKDEQYNVKYIRISTDVSRRLFHLLTEPIPYTFASVNRRNNEARTAQIAVWPRLYYFVD